MVLCGTTRHPTAQYASRDRFSGRCTDARDWREYWRPGGIDIASERHREEGGVVTAPCSTATVVGCTVGQVSGWFQTAFCDGKVHNGTAFRVNQTHCSCRLPPSFAEAPVAVAFVDAAGRATKPLLTDYVALWHTSLGKRPYLSSDKYAELLVRVHPSIKGACVAAKLSDGTHLLDWSPVNAGSTTRLLLPLSSLRPISEEKVGYVTPPR